MTYAFSDDVLALNPDLASAPLLKRRKTYVGPSEHDEQVALIALAQTYAGQHPALALLVATPNGGKRPKAAAGKMKAEGQRAGYPDLHLPVARQGYHSLYVELKRGDGGEGLSPAQAWWHARLRAEGHKVEVCHGCAWAWRAITAYLGIAE